MRVDKHQFVGVNEITLALVHYIHQEALADKRVNGCCITRQERPLEPGMLKLFTVFVKRLYRVALRIYRYRNKIGQFAFYIITVQAVDVAINSFAKRRAIRVKEPGYKYFVIECFCSDGLAMLIIQFKIGKRMKKSIGYLLPFYFMKGAR